MIYGIGCDIVKTSRIKKLIQKSENLFLDQILSKEEKNIYFSINNHEKKISYLAKRFAGKEAFSKALGTGIGQGVNFTDISIMNDNLGKPFIKLEKTFPQFENKEIKINISISDESSNAVAFVVISM